MADRHLYFNWDVDIMLMDLLLSLRLPVARATRIYNAIHDRRDEIIGAIQRGGSWPFQLIDRRYATWQSAEKILDTEVGDYMDHLPGPAVESVCYDLAELARRKGGGTDAAGTEGRVPPERLPGGVD